MMNNNLQRFELSKITEVVVDPATIRRLWTWTVAADTEISALGEVEIIGTTLRLTDDIHLLKQKGTFASTELDMGAVDELIRSRMKAKLPTETLRFWFHTHPRMEAFFSMTDERTIKELNEFMPIVLAAVFNTAGRSQWCLSQGRTQTLWTHIVPGHPPTIKECEEVTPLIEKFVEEDMWFPRWRSVRRWKNKRVGR